MFEIDGMKIRELLLEKRMTHRDFAKAASITETTAHKIARGGARTNAKTAGKVADALGVDAKQIVKDFD